MTLTDEQMERLLSENMRKTEEVYEICKKVKRMLLIGQIMGVLRILIIVVPLILAIIYLPPFFKGYMQQYQELLGGEGSSILDQLKELQGTR